MGAVLFATQGYSDTRTWPIAMFVDVELANAHKLEIENEWRRVVDLLWIRRSSGQPAVGMMPSFARVSAAGLFRFEDSKGRVHGCVINDDGTISVYGRRITTTLPSLGVNRQADLSEDLDLAVIELPLRGVSP